jgi:WD40 repeat protein
VTCDHDRYLVSACDDASVRIWELDTGQYASVLAGHTGAVHLAVVAADHNLVVTASKDLTMRAWSVTAALQSTVLQPPHPKQKYKLLIVTTSQVLFGHDGSLTACIFLPDKYGGRRVLTAANDSSFRVWEGDGKCVHVVDGMKHTVRCVAVCKALGLVYLGDSGGAVQVLQASDFSFSRTQQGSAVRGWVLSVAVNVDGHYMVCCYQHGDCVVFGAQSGDEIMKIDDNSGAMCLCSAFSGDSKWMCVGYDDGHATVYSVTKQSIERKYSMTVSALDVLVSYNPPEGFNN